MEAQASEPKRRATGVDGERRAADGTVGDDGRSMFSDQGNGARVNTSGLETRFPGERRVEILTDNVLHRRR